MRVHGLVADTFDAAAAAALELMRYGWALIRLPPWHMEWRQTVSFVVAAAAVVQGILLSPFGYCAACWKGWVGLLARVLHAGTVTVATCATVTVSACAVCTVHMMHLRQANIV